MNHQRGWGKENEDAATWSNEAVQRESMNTSFSELSKSVDGDKYHNDLIYLVDKRINCCYLPQTQTGVGELALLWLFVLGEGLSWKRQGLGKTGTDKQEECAKSRIRGSPGLRGRLLSRHYPVCSNVPCYRDPHSATIAGRGNIFCEPF